jgi:hypothetical protein
MKKKVFKKPFNSVKGLSKEELFEREIDKAYKRIYGVKEESWEVKFKRADILSNIVEKDTNNGIYYRMKDIINRHI